MFNDDLSIVATNRIDERIKGKVTLDKSNCEFECAVLPRSRGWYKVNIQWKGDHILGSPFNINIIAPPLPENVHVHCLKRSVVVGKESKFWIDSSRAGPGLLSISVCGPEHPFEVFSSSDPANPWTFMSQFCPTHTGDYIINMIWSGEHIPGSPFSLTVTYREEEGVAMGETINHCCSGSVYGDENLQEGVTFF